MKTTILLFSIVIICLQLGYSQPGSLDPTFGDKGIVRTDFGASTNVNSTEGGPVVTAPDGTIYLVFRVNSVNLITHLYSNGSIDTSYGINGYSQPVNLFATSGVLQDDGKIVLAGYGLDSNRSGMNPALAVYNAD